MANFESELEQLLRDIIDGFDQEGCSPGCGTVATTTINQARTALGMEPLEDEEDHMKEGETGDPEESDLESNPEDESAP